MSPTPPPAYGLPTSPRDGRNSPPRQLQASLPRLPPGAAATRDTNEPRLGRKPSYEVPYPREGSRNGSRSNSSSGSHGRSSPTAHHNDGRSSSPRRSRSPSLDSIGSPRKLANSGTPPSSFRPSNLPVAPAPAAPSYSPPRGGSVRKGPSPPSPPKSLPSPGGEGFGGGVSSAPTASSRPALRGAGSNTSLRSGASSRLSTKSRRPRLALWPSSAYVPAPYTWRCIFEGGVTLWGFVLVVLGGTVLGGRDDPGAHPAVRLLLFASAVVLLYFPTVLVLARVRPAWLRSPLDKVWLHVLVEVVLWAFFLGGSASIASSSLSAPVRLSSALGFICWALLTLDLALTALRVAGIRRGGDGGSARTSPSSSSRDVEKQGSVSAPAAPSVDPSLPMHHFLLVVPITASNLFPSYASRYPTGPVRTWVPPSSSAWPSALPPEAKAEMATQEFRNSPNAAFVGNADASHIPAMRETGYRSNATIPSVYSRHPSEGPSQHWSTRNAEQGYLETLATEELRRMGGMGDMEAQRNQALVPQPSQESFQRPPAPAPRSSWSGSSADSRRLSSYQRGELRGLPTPPETPPLSASFPSSPAESVSELNTSVTHLNTAQSVRGAEVRQAMRQNVGGYPKRF